MIIVYDTETTGLLGASAAGPGGQPHIIEFAGVRLDDKLVEVDHIRLLIRPSVKVPADATRIHGINDEMLAGKAPFSYTWDSIARFFLGTSIAVGHNLLFDKRLLAWELERIDKVTNFPWPRRDICTAEETNKLLDHRMNLSDLHLSLLGRGFDGAHGAMADTRATADVLRKYVEQGKIIL